MTIALQNSVRPNKGQYDEQCGFQSLSGHIPERLPNYKELRRAIQKLPIRHPQQRD